MSLLLSLHLLAVVIWVGGMFFAYVVLRPAALKQLEPPVRLTLWSACFATFFVWVWIAIGGLFVTGYAMIIHIYRDFGTAPVFVHAMHGITVLMTLIFLLIYFVLYRRLRTAVQASNWPVGGKVLAQIRWLVAVNLILGIAIIVVVGMGRYSA